MGFTINEINNMTTHESNSYVYQFKNAKQKEKESLEKARQNISTKRVLKGRPSKRRGRR